VWAEAVTHGHSYQASAVEQREDEQDRYSAADA
jgi:hypothetical protein